MRLAPSPSRAADTRLRGAMLMPLCALAVHQLRYHLAYGVHAGNRLAHDGHAYLGTVEPLILLAAALAAGTVLGQIARRWQPAGGPHHRRARIARVWALGTVALLAVYCGQELLEGTLASGHAPGLTGILGHGGWIAVPVAAVIAGGLAAALRIADALVEFLVCRRARPLRPASRTSPRPAVNRRNERLAALKGAIARRAPPRLARS